MPLKGSLASGKKFRRRRTGDFAAGAINKKIFFFDTDAETGFLHARSLEWQALTGQARENADMRSYPINITSEAVCKVDKKDPKKLKAQMKDILDHL